MSRGKSPPKKSKSIKVKIVPHMTHCPTKSCRGILETKCFRSAYGEKHLGLKRRYMCRVCVKCDGRYFDGNCYRFNRVEEKLVQKQYNRRALEDGIFVRNEKGHVERGMCHKLTVDFD